MVEAARPAAPPRTPGQRALSFLKEVLVILVVATVLSFVLKTWVVQSFWIPSGSMRTTLMEHDRVAVSKLTPRVTDLDRGDVIVFEDPGGWHEGSLPEQPPTALHPLTDALAWIGLLPTDEGTFLIKRIIGMPGDRVVCCTADGRVSVNGTPITETYVAAGEAPSLIPFDITVPPDRVWVMGDNRGHSGDSRMHDGPTEGSGPGTGVTGSVPMAAITGRAVVIMWPLNHLRWLGTPSEVFSQVPEPTGARPSS